MQWEKQGLVFAPDGEVPWARSYALLPTVEFRADSSLRVYFSSLDDQMFGRIGYVDLDPANLSRVVRFSAEPVLDLGRLGCFDDSGVNPSSIVTQEGRTLMYYIGWQRCVRVPYMLFTGLAEKTDDGTFKKLRQTPVLDRSEDEPFSRAAPFVLFEDGDWKVWYWSCSEWRVTDRRVHYFNSIRYATSTDGIDWRVHPHHCLRPQSAEEYSVGRPCVLRRGGEYHMWYSIRSFDELYAIGYARSTDGIHWVRCDDEAGIAKSAEGWDSEMVCYPYVFELDDRLHMFYNGNHHGASGFGWAIATE